MRDATVVANAVTAASAAAPESVTVAVAVTATCPDTGSEVPPVAEIVPSTVTSPTTAMLTVQLGLPHVEGRLFRDHLFCAYYDDSWNIVSKTWALNKVENIIL